MFKYDIWKYKVKKIFRLLSPLQKKAGFLAVAIMVVAGITTQAVSADLGTQIQQLQRENAQNQSIVSQLQAQATSYQDAIAQLQAQINNVQAKIDLNTSRQNEIQASIVANEAELARQKTMLGESIRVMYIEGQMTQIEMFATSKNLSEFVDKEEYRTIINNKIQSTLQRITTLQNELKEQKVQVERLLAEQQVQRRQLAESRAEQANMLAYNESQQNSYNQKTQANQARIEALIAAQRRANNSTDGGYYFLRFPGSVETFSPYGYPHANAGFSMQLGPCSFNDGYPDSPDGWGYCTRQCVSFAAWAVGASGRDIPMYYGNAKDWVSEARANGVSVHRYPQPGDVAISTSGQWGHAMYVVQVEGNRMLVWQYNNSLNGEFSTQWRNF